jgi:hypothetical protein
VLVLGWIWGGALRRWQERRPQRRQEDAILETREPTEFEESPDELAEHEGQ